MTLTAPRLKIAPEPTALQLKALAAPRLKLTASAVAKRSPAKLRSTFRSSLLESTVVGTAVLAASRCSGHRAGGKQHLGVARGAVSSLTAEFGRIELHGAAAAWLLEQQRSLDGELKPTPIQARSMRPIRVGQSVAMSSPTGTGKTLAYLLPLWERLVEADVSPVKGPRLLIVAPSEDLVVQIGSVALELAGMRSKEDLVLVLRRNTEKVKERLLTSAVLVATPTLLLEFCEIETMVDAWLRAAAGLRGLVVDEVDCLVPAGGAKNNDLEDVLKLATFAGGPPEERAAGPLQLVLASASIDPWTLAFFEEVTKVSLKFVHVDPWASSSALVVQQSDASDHEEGYADDEDDEDGDKGIRTSVKVDEELVQLDVVHAFTLKDKVLDQQGHVLTKVRPLVKQVIHNLQPRRCLLVLSERRPVSERGESVGRYLRSWRRDITSIGYTLVTASAVVQRAIDLHGGRSPAREVIIGRSETIRGLDLAGVDAVVIVGELASAREYLHIAGRTARWDLGRGAPSPGNVVSIVPRTMANTLKRWSRELGFRLDAFQLEAMDS